MPAGRYHDGQVWTFKGAGRGQAEVRPRQSHAAGLSGLLEPGGRQVRPLTHLRWIDAFATH